jgi:hypothetical protein
MVAYAVDISTVKNPTPSRVHVRFMERREAEDYARWLKRRNPGRVVSFHIVPLQFAQANAVFARNRLHTE